MWKTDSLEKTLILGKIEGRGEGDDRRWDGWMPSPTQWREFGWTPGVGDGQGGLVCWSPWGCKESDMTERLNWTEPSLTHTVLNFCAQSQSRKVFQMKLRSDVINNCLINSLLFHSMCKVVIDLISVAVFPQFLIPPLKHVLKEELISLSFFFCLWYSLFPSVWQSVSTQ